MKLGVSTYSEMVAVDAIVVCFSIDAQFPKLDVAGSIPVSRSLKFSNLYCR